MKKDEFIKQCFGCGFTSEKQAIQWAEENPKEDYTEDDFIQAHYRFTLDCGEPSGGEFYCSNGGKSTKRSYHNGGLSFVH